MYRNKLDSQEKRLVGYCFYCNSEIYEGEGCLYIADKGWVHYDPNEPLNNCYFPEKDDE